MLLKAIQYKADTYRIFGVALFTPGGKLFLDVIYFREVYEIHYLIILIVVSLMLSVIGLAFINEGYDILHEEGD